MARSKLWVALAVLAVLAGCRTAPPARPAVAAAAVSAWPARRAELQQRDHYEVKGRVAVAANGEGFNARLRWVQEGPRSQLSLSGPLGAGGAQITAEGGNLTIVNSRGERLGAQEARDQLVQHLGFEPPLGSLRYWMLGVPDPALPVGAELLDDGQHLTHLEQGGWQIDYAAYMVVQDESLPAKVTLLRGNVRVRLLVDSWSG
jgi:outer membrane lipoprotein LolB